MSSTPQFLQRPNGISLAYERTPGRGPGVMFLHGFRSDMTGAKAVAVEAFCRARGQAFVRFDCRGHGRSSGHVQEGTIGHWAEDVIAMLDELTEGPQILVGSSMGGWLMLLAALARPERVAGLVGIAAAPDFTRSMWAQLPAEARRAIETQGLFQLPSSYGPDPYAITRELIEDGERNCLLDRTIPFTGPVRLLHGMQDADVPWQTSLRLAQTLASDDVILHFIKDGDHRLSRPTDIDRLCEEIGRLSDMLERSIS